MVLVTTKRYKRDRAITYGAIGASSLVGITGTALGITALVKTHNVKSDVDNLHTDMARRMSAEEGMSKQFISSISQIQDVLEKNDMLRVRR